MNSILEDEQNHDEVYLGLARKILGGRRSVFKSNRTGIESISYFGPQMEFDLSQGFPLLTTKKMFWRGIAEELFWFLRGETNIKPLVDKGIHFWDGNAFQGHLIRNGKDKQLPLYSPEWYVARDEFVQRIKEDAEFASVEGDLGPVYGSQWRRWETKDGKTIDQIGDVINLLHKSPSSRRIIVSAWNPEEVPNMVLPPCHSIFQLNVAGDQLDCKLYQRSADFFLGVPFNTASYALLTTMFAQEAGLKPGRFIHTFGDAHFYAGCNERGRFYADPVNLEAIKLGVRFAEKPEDYINIKQDIENRASPELQGRDGLDHTTGILEQLARDPRKHPIPTLTIAKKPFDKIGYNDLKLEYTSEPDIKRRMAV